MKRKWTDLHRFLTNHFFYPVLMSTCLAGVIYAFRVVVSGSWTFAYLGWNLFLAWVPYLCSLWAAALHRRHPGRWWLLLFPGVLWLLFFPNAPYIVTDFYHLRERPPMPLWYDIGLIAIFAWTGLFLAVGSLRTMQTLVGTYTHRIASWVFVGVALGLSGIGDYLGRFDRWNSWDLMVHPRKVLRDLAAPLFSPLNHPQFVGFSLMFTALLLVIYLMFTSFSRRQDPDA